MISTTEPAVWFPVIRCGTGTDVFTERLASALEARGVRCAITWLPHRAEYAPWTVPIPKPPAWANLVHINSWLHPRFVPSGLAVVVTVHHSVHDPALAPYNSSLQRLYHQLWVEPIEVRNLGNARAITTVSRFTAQQVERVFGHRNLVVIPNGIDVEQTFTPGAPRFPQRPFRLLYVGNWIVRKGVDLLGPILEYLGPDFELIYTADRNGAHLRYCLPSNARCIGRLDAHTLAQAYRAADALLFPSRSEGLPLGVIEAMACGLPVIASNVSALPEVIEHGVTGWLCPVDDVKAFAKAARNLFRDQDNWAAMRLAARERAEKSFGLCRQTEAFVDVYNVVIAGHASKELQPTVANGSSQR